MFKDSQYSLRKKFLKLIGADFEIFDSTGNLAFFVHQEGFKLKEVITFFTDSTKSEAILVIQARSILDFGATYDVTDAKTNEKVGALRRKGLKSMFVDEWSILNSNDEEIGLVKEDSVLLATIRRTLTSLIPQNYDGFVGSEYVADYRQNFNPFLYKLEIDFSKDQKGLLDRRLGLAMAVLLAAIEGKQS